MTLAFVLQTYKDVEQIVRLARTLKRGAEDCSIVVSHRGCEDDYKQLRAEHCVDHVIPSPGGRAAFGVIDGLISSIRRLEKTQAAYDWLTILSGQDYPIRPLCELEAELALTDYDAYFHHFDAMNEAEAAAPPMRWPQSLVRHRYYFQYVRLKEEPTRFERAILKIPRMLLDRSSGWRLHTSFAIMVGRKAKSVPFSDDFRLYGGNYWMTMSRKAARTLVEFVDDRPDIVNYFRGTVVPEEAFVATVLANAKGIRLSRRELRYLDFSSARHGALRELNMADVDSMLSSGCFFARKFAPADGELIEAMDRHVFPCVGQVVEKPYRRDGSEPIPHRAPPRPI